ncbi:ABC transporter substrate-binding protein [Adhaeribacter aerolatus]|uniref:ABC transporter substrate-binding protein n=1 Tax=Adhaeribacter aerolatus TaxID=670289 RepID=A0A512AVK5_9BACT|nr:transporter substrate-binding domain-containing protein [Adhaeribacter aerolatus]GEO03748.1 ABC transporter substrate-binding protein [Adhaeribacter aerolatus]
MKIKVLFLLGIWLFAGCENYPKDPDKTLEKVRHGTLVVGYAENPPWVIKTATEPGGIEAQLIKEFAAGLGARIQWQNDTEQDLFERLEKKELHLVIAGLTDKNAWKSKISFTKPYLQKEKDKHVMAVQKGENAFVLELEKFLKNQEEKLKKTTAP